LKHRELASAELCWRQAVQVDPACIPAWTFLTDFLAVSNRPDEALVCLRQLISITERTAHNLWVLADKSCFQKQYELGRGLLRDALLHHPTPETLSSIKMLLVEIDFALHDWGAAIEGASEILQREPENLKALAIRQRSYFKLCWTPEDVADSRRFIEIRPDPQVHSRMIWSHAYLPETTPEKMLELSSEWCQRYAEPLASRILPHKNIPDPERRLRVGYLSPDIYQHAMMKLLPGVLKHHNRELFEVFVYSINSYKDEATDLAQTLVENFVELPASRDLIAARVQADGIDILIDLAHRTMHAEAFLVFALKPAPIQCTWMGFLATTGLKTMDYFIGDQHLPCPGTEHLFSEKICRLGRIHSCYSPFVDPGIEPPPCLRNGFITFGSFNDPRKIHRDTIKVWSVILHLHPGSKMLLKYWNLETELGSRRIREWFLEDGIGLERLQFEGLSRGIEYAACWNKIDLHLDSFPYNGGTTTLDAIWMGVPVVSVGGRMTVASCAASILSEVGIPVASTLEQYIAMAALLAKTIPNTPDMRSRLRETVLKSKIMDGVDLVQELEIAYRRMWRTWCAEQLAE
jgi:predicted O-linked N-acetylglucosamine transferase (SPINDLY family)